MLDEEPLNKALNEVTGNSSTWKECALFLSSLLKDYENGNIAGDTETNLKLAEIADAALFDIQPKACFLALASLNKLVAAIPDAAKHPMLAKKIETMYRTNDIYSSRGYYNQINDLLSDILVQIKFMDKDFSQLSDIAKNSSGLDPFFALKAYHAKLAKRPEAKTSERALDLLDIAESNRTLHGKNPDLNQNFVGGLALEILEQIIDHPDMLQVRALPEKLRSLHDNQKYSLEVRHLAFAMWNQLDYRQRTGRDAMPLNRRRLLTNDR